MTITRRTFGIGALAVAGTAIAPQVMSAGRPRVVVIGGGAGGGTVARYVAKASKGDIDVVLIEPTRTYYTCFFSNLYLGGFRDFSSIGHTYGKLASDYGITVVHDWAIGVDRSKKSVQLASGADVSYDRLVVSPGIDFRYDTVPGYGVESSNKMPHAWKAGSQTQLLKAQVEAMRPGGLYMMVAPPNPFRCPPGPYERISMVAHVLKQKNPTAKIVIVDTKEKFSKQGLFTEGWSNHYEGMVEWLPGSIAGKIKRIDADKMEIHTDAEVFKPDVANVIPGQKAGTIATAAGLTNDSGFCPIVPATMQSQMDENIYLVGDSTIAGDMPKSGYSANSQAKVAAMAIRASLSGSKLFPARFANTCWSLIATDDGVKVGAKYEATEEKIAKTEGFISKTGEDAQLRKQTYEESIGWYNGITTDVFG
jgi:sulfide dehydrogenase [flavocytochrome c] flavoprotein subunit